uniref:Trihelix transcription factor GTL2 n=1 Tax=Talaromyces marneffei PM1 TaxID=1077442 RepID=A0A093W3M4_TALMA
MATMHPKLSKLSTQSPTTPKSSTSNAALNHQDIFRALEASASLLPKLFLSSAVTSSDMSSSSATHVEYSEHQYQNPPPPPPSPIGFPSSPC